MENPSEQPTNQEFTRTDLDSVINERNQQAMAEQAGLAQYTASNIEAAERAKQARDAIEAATNPDLITAVPGVANATAEEKKPDDAPIQGIPENLRNPQ